MGKRLTLGPKPEVDPLEESSSSSFSLTTSTEIRWDQRTQGRALAQPLFLSLICIIIGLSYSIIPLIAGGAVLFLILVLPSICGNLRKATLRGSPWNEVNRADTSCVTSADFKGLCCKTSTGMRYMIGMNLGAAKSILLGDVSSFVRAVDSSSGFCLTVTMRPEKIQRALDEESQYNTKR
jgi:hypothetical protein